jgi:predicted Zn-dependent protease with MMP-like domain
MSSLISEQEQTAQKSNGDEFEKMVDAGIAAIPKRFLQKLDNVSIVIEDEPTLAQKEKLHLRRGWTLFGLYEGVPQTKRGVYYGSVLPDKITIFRKPIIESARDMEHIKEIVKNTVWHEIAHHFGMNEEEVRRSDARRKNISIKN